MSSLLHAVPWLPGCQPTAPPPPPQPLPHPHTTTPPQVSDVMSAIFISQGTIVTGALDGSLLVWDVSGSKGAFGSCIQVGGQGRRG